MTERPPAESGRKPLGRASRMTNQQMQDVHTNRFTPRDYQEELLECALSKNTIVCLGTGTGKTFIAVMLIKELAYKVRAPYDDSGQRTFFLVPHRPLVTQQAKVIREHTDLNVGGYHGNMTKDGVKIDDWSKEIWEGEFCKNQVLVMTAQIFLDLACLKAFVPFSKMNVLIFDECHHAFKDDIYKQIMKNCELRSSPEERPRILGLSASLVNNKCKPNTLWKQIRELEETMLSTVQSGSDVTHVSEYGSKPKEMIIIYAPYRTDSVYIHKVYFHLLHVRDFIHNVSPKSWPKQIHLKKRHLKRYIETLVYVLKTMGPWCACEIAKVFHKDIDRVVNFLRSDYMFATNLFLVVSTSLELASSLFEKHMSEVVCDDKALHFSSSKLHKLIHILKPYSPLANQNETKAAGDNDGPKMASGQQQTLCGIIFVERRVTALLLNLWLNHVKQVVPELNFLSVNFVMGQSTADALSQEGQIKVDHQELILEKFRNKELNLLVATSVVEEGLDVRSCNLVVRYDKPQNYSSYVQSKGRARAEKSIYAMLVEAKEKNQFVDELTDYQTIERILLHNIADQDMPGEEDIVLHSNHIDVPPYMPKKDGACVTLESAISLVNRYCIKLPSDSFTKLAPQWTIKELDGEEKRYLCIVYLPINSPLKDPIYGMPMRNKCLAKRSAALETCKKLHEIGELDDNLIPIGKEAVKFEDDIDDFEEELSIAGKPGTTKRRQYYYKQVADALRGSLPKCDIPCHLYMFKMKLTCPIPEDQNTRGRKIHDPAETPRSFGILTTKAIPPICRFPVFTRSGEVTVHLESIASDVMFSQDQLDKLSYFHRYTFADVLRLEKYPMLFDPQTAESSFYVVPLNSIQDSEEYDVDWDFVDLISQQKDNENLRSRSEEERKQFQFKTEDYVNAVVMPWYRNLDKPQFFYVAEICQDLNPRSDFPGAGFETFEKYYQSKYGINIMNPEQPLLDVDHTSARLNLLTPRYVNRKGVTLPTSSEQTKKAKRENLQQKQILIPELCVIHPFPASLWRKAVCLPCILYRVNSLLLAEQLRLTVAREIGVGLVELSKGFEWPMLDFGWTLADVLKAQSEQKEEKRPRNEVIPSPIPPMNISNNASKNECLDFTIGTWSNDMAAVIKNTDDILDGEMDDYLADEEIKNINFSNIELLGDSGNSDNYFGTWNSVRSDSPGVPMIRYGSPSNFENSGWDAEWDMDYEDSKVFNLDIPGLGYISAPGMFNVEKLSMDLASCREDDEMWDSFDEESLPDETENPTDPDSQATATTPQVNDDEDMSQNKVPFSHTTKKITDKNFCDSELFKDASVQTERCVLPAEEEEDVESYDPSIKNFVLKLKEKQNKNVLSLIVKPNNEDECDLESGVMEDECDTMMQLASNMIEDDDEEETDEGYSKSDDLISTESGEQHAPITSWTNCDHTESLLAFGELLPNREQLAIEGSTSSDLHFDHQSDLETLPGPSPSIILQAFTMSNANDGINLERLETVGDSFLKYAITTYLFSTYHSMHEGRLSFLRSKQISNYNLYRLGKRKHLGEMMIATKFEPNDNWLPPCYTVPKGLEQALIESGMPAASWNLGSLEGLTHMTEDQIRRTVMEKRKNQENIARNFEPSVENMVPYIPYNLLTQHSIPDKSIADCVEALIGAYLISCGPLGALLFMKWLGLKVLLPDNLIGDTKQTPFPLLKSPLLANVDDAEDQLMRLYSGLDNFEQNIGYVFNDKAYLVQAFTHNSYYYNRVTDCYQRLEFLGDAVLDYLITRHLYEDPQKHSPGTLTDLRSALVNNTFFASLAVRYNFHKYLKILSPYLFRVVAQFVKIKESSPGVHDYEAHYLEEEECENAEEVEVPKALGDIFESVAGAIYLDSGMSLDVVWKVYYAMMKPEIEYFSTHVPKSPIRELLEMEPQTAKFEKAEIVAGRKVRVVVSVFGKGRFVGIGRNKRIAKSTAAKRALRALKRMAKEKGGSQAIS